MENLANSLSLSSLLCQEDETCYFNENEDDDHNSCWHKKNNDDPCFVLDSKDDIEYIERMIETESSFRCRKSRDDDCPSTARHSWLTCARLDAVGWILNTTEVFGFQLHTAYLSVTYFDRFLSKQAIDDGKLWATRLLSVACLSLAAKMEECKVPPLSEFPVADYCFENKVIQRMELLVLNTLEWKMGSITPFTYVHYFTSKICAESRPKQIVPKAVQFILAIIKEINLLDHRPSIIAAAAVLAASNGQLTRTELEMKMNVISSWGSLENEHICSCYITMQETVMGKVKTPQQVISSISTSMHSSSMDVLENSSFTSGVGIKRRLTFGKNDQSCPV